MNVHHWSFHPRDDITRRLRALKREMTGLCLWHSFQSARSGRGSFEECLYERTMIWRYLPWKSRSISQDPLSEENELNEPRAETLKREQRFELVQYRGTCEFGDLVDHVAETAMTSERVI